MTGLDWRLAGLALLLGLAVGGRGAWMAQDWRYGKQLAALDLAHTQEREAAAAQVIEQMGEQQTAREALEQRLAVQSQTHYKEMEDAKSYRQRLRDQLATAGVRLSVLTANGAAEGGQCGVPAAAGTGRVVHGPARAELDPAHAQRIVGITGDGDDGLRALAACQGYVRALSQKNMAPSG
ncbi:lysis protein [Pseudomonas mosselii]|uniref:lysis system i-spanin subunit Rz n=1 Tax=Pseudomonas mosselii TaxID=78327 RepID=UPI0018D905CA|nr:lysis system i-spanin subunit Rz [Pseudomonas mosselii]MBH3307932.1 lysis protein [Pseudomonas mosselii]MBH3326578.1 lysis protein [Pseudomonas mosselii]